MSYLLIINPKSGNKQKEVILNAVKKRFGDKLNIVYTEKKGDATELAYNSVENVVIAAGGDGTVNEVINGLMKKEKEERPKLAILPLGTSNMIARSIGIKKKKIEEILELFACERSRRIDIGKANDRFFLIACGIGIDAHAYNNVEPKLKKIVGEIAYPLALFKTMVDYKPEELTIELCGEKKTGYYVLVCNIVKLHKLFSLIKDGKDYDGEFDVLIFQKKDLVDNLRYIYGILTKKYQTFKDVQHIKCKELLVTAKNPVLNHVDAEINGNTPVKIKMFEKALEIIC